MVLYFSNCISCVLPIRVKMCSIANLSALSNTYEGQPDVFFAFEAIGPHFKNGFFPFAMKTLNNWHLKEKKKIWV